MERGKGANFWCLITVGRSRARRKDKQLAGGHLVNFSIPLLFRARTKTGHIRLVAVVLSLSLGEAPDLVAGHYDWLAILALSSGWIVHVRLPTLVSISLLFVTPIGFLQFGAVEPRLFHLMAMALAIRSIFTLSRRGVPQNGVLWHGRWDGLSLPAS